MVESNTLKRTQRRYDKKRAKAPRLPGSRLTTEEGKLMEALYEKCGGNKKHAILSAAKKLVDESEVE